MDGKGQMFRKIVSAGALVGMLGACSTSGDFYKEGDPVNGDFSVWRTVALPFAVLGVAAIGAAAGYAAAQPAPSPPPPPRQMVSCTSNSLGGTTYTNCY